MPGPLGGGAHSIPWWGVGAQLLLGVSGPHQPSLKGPRGGGTVPSSSYPLTVALVLPAWESPGLIRAFLGVAHGAGAPVSHWMEHVPPSPSWALIPGQGLGAGAGLVSWFSQGPFFGFSSPLVM